MNIPKHELEEMNKLLQNGEKITDIWNKYPNYDYWLIYNAVKDFSLLGKKRMITNRINNVRNSKSKEERNEFLDEIDNLVTEIYNLSKENGKKLTDIGKILEK